MAAKITPLRYLALVVVALVGLIFVVTGSIQLASQGWDRVDATVESCTARNNRTDGSSRITFECAVTWTGAGGPRSAAVNVGATEPTVGGTVSLRVNGDTIAVETPPWIAAAMAGLGATMLGVVAVMMLRARVARRRLPLD